MSNGILKTGGMLLILALAPAATADLLWTQTFGGSEYDWGRMIQQTSDGGYVVVGDTYSFGAGHFDIWLIRMGVDGDTLWTRTYGGTNEERGYSVQETADGGFIIAGTTGSYGSGAYDVWLVKTDADGSQEWSQTFGGSLWDWGWSAEEVIGGGYIITGYTESYGPGVSAVWLIRTDSEGALLWDETFGGSSSEYGCSVQQTLDGGFIVVGDTYSYGAGSRDIWLIKTDGNGDSLWTRTFGGGGSDGGSSVCETPDGDYVITGYTKSFGAGQADVWLIKTDGAGDSLWTRTFGGSGDDHGCSVRLTSDEGYVVAGYTESRGAGDDDVWLIRADSHGDTLWTETFGGSGHDRGRSALETADGGYVIAGEVFSYANGAYDIWVIKAGPACGIEQRPGDAGNRMALCNRPNPFGERTEISFSAAIPGIALLRIQDSAGRLVRQLTVSQRIGGNRIVWDGRDTESHAVCSGMYHYRLEREGGSVASGRMLLLR
jgi:hypothetical protein